MEEKARAKAEELRHQAVEENLHLRTTMSDLQGDVKEQARLAYGSLESKDNGINMLIDKAVAMLDQAMKGKLKFHDLEETMHELEARGGEIKVNGDDDGLGAVLVHLSQLMRSYEVLVKSVCSNCETL